VVASTSAPCCSSSITMSTLPRREATCKGVCSSYSKNQLINIVTYSGVLFTMELYCTPKSQHTTVKHSQQLFGHTYTSNLYGLGTLTPIEFFQQDLLWQSSNTNSHSCSQKVSKHTSLQSIVGLSVHLHTTAATRRIFNH
jgi:hypothetical protein